VGIITRGAMRPKRPKIVWGRGAIAGAPAVTSGVGDGWWHDPTQWLPTDAVATSRTYLGTDYLGLRAAAFSLFGLGAGDYVYTGPVIDGLAPNTVVTIELVAQWYTTTDTGPADTSPYIQVSGGTPNTLAGLSYTNGTYGPLAPYTVTGLTNSAGQFVLSFGWTFGGGSINGGLGFNLISLTTYGYDGGPALYFAENLDRAVAFAKRAPGSMQAKGADALSLALWHLGTDDVLTGLARWIPLDTGTDRYGTTSTGWHGTDGTDGWRSFLEHARERKPFTFYPDRDNAAVSYTCVWEGEVARPDPEGNRHYQQPFAIRSLSGAFEGY
jgi:hypothetical protein